MNAQVDKIPLQCLDCHTLIYLPVLVSRTCLCVFYGEMGGYLLLADH